jgi:hypothetical protein
VGDAAHATTPDRGIFASVRLPIPSSMELREIMPRLRDLKLSVRDLCILGILAAPIWVVLGIVGSDLPMVCTACAVAMASTLQLRPGLVAWLRAASAVLRPLSLPR